MSLAFRTGINKGTRGERRQDKKIGIEKKKYPKADAYFLKDRVKEKIPDFRRSCFSRTLSPMSVFLLCTWAILLVVG
jgi:hypothetical protein